MSRSHSDQPVRQLLDHARELSELSRRAVELSQALQALSGVDPDAERERLQHGAGAVTLEKIPARIEEIQARAEAAARRDMGPLRPADSPSPRARLSRSFV